MATPRVDIISIGTLSRNRLWNETSVTRTAHATTTLLRAGKKVILVDPGLPPSIIGARLYERTGLKPDKVTHVFLTNFRNAHRHGLAAFTEAKVLMHENEIEASRQKLDAILEEAPPEDEDRKFYARERELLDTISAADDKLGDGVDLFPLFGYTPGTCGLLISSAITTTLLTSDAVPTLDHFLAGQLLPDTGDIPAAQEAFQEVYEIADLIVPGHDNVFLNPRAQGM